ncbi:class I tRNA ligase family protein, partial [Candidatus Peregrinibacteria bacterium]|nr:class I tRNA ligase family protein [Candidatus Peregrinibacteria bacterium]
YLELSKGEANPAVLIHTLRTLLTLLHPYCPFVTEELWDSVKPTDAGMLIAHEWPVVNERLKDQTAQDDLQTVIDVISGIRSLRSDQGIEPGAKISITLLTEKHGMLLESQESHIKSIARVESLTIDTNPGAAKPDNAASSFLKDVEIHMPLDGLIDKDKEIEKLGKEKAKLEGFIKGVNAKLGNEKFVENAQAEVVALEREKLSTAEGKLAKVLDRLESLK